MLSPRSELSDDDVRTAIKNSGGVKGSLLIPEAPFELLVRRAISRLLPSALQCKDFVHAELLRIAGQCCPQDVGRFPTLQVRSSLRRGGSKCTCQMQGVVGLVKLLRISGQCCPQDVVPTLQVRSSLRRRGSKCMGGMQAVLSLGELQAGQQPWFCKLSALWVPFVLVGVFANGQLSELW